MKGGIIIPDAAKEKSQEGEVVGKKASLPAAAWLFSELFPPSTS